MHDAAALQVLARAEAAAVAQARPRAPAQRDGRVERRRAPTVAVQLRHVEAVQRHLGGDAATAPRVALCGYTAVRPPRLPDARVSARTLITVSHSVTLELLVLRGLYTVDDN